MESAASIAAELKRQVISMLPSGGLTGGGMHNFVVKASISLKMSPKNYFEAIGLFLQQLADEYPEWEIGFEGDPHDLEITFTR